MTVISVMASAMRELAIEQYLCARAKARGGVAIKHGVGGWPDRIVVIRGAHGWCEVKRPGGVARPLQEQRIRELADRGALVRVVDSYAGVEAFLDEVERAAR